MMSDDVQPSGDATRQSERTGPQGQGIGLSSLAATSTTEFEPLLEAAHPQVYSQNAFRILGVSAYANERDIRKQLEKIEMMEKIGNASRTTGGLLPLDPPPSPDAIREARQRLTNPERRFIEELFWFWPADAEQAGGDKAFAALAGCDTEKAAEIWISQEKEDKDQVRAMHNLALLCHLSALDLELDALTGSSSNVPEHERNKKWQQAFSYWGMLFDDERFWISLNRRVRELDDPRLTAETARRIRTSLPLALLSINAQLALRAAEIGETATAHLHTYLISQSGFDQDAIDDALQRTAQPIRERLRTSCQTAKTQVEADVSQTEQVIRRLFDETKPLLSTLDRLLPAGNIMRDGAHDEVTETARESLVRFGNKLDDWTVPAEVLQLFSAIPVGESERADFKKDLDLFRSNAEYQGITQNLKPIKRAPSLYSVNGFGVKLYGHADYDFKTQSYIATHYLIFFDIPLLPLGRYRVTHEDEKTYRFWGKAPFRLFDKIHLAVVLLLPVIIFLVSNYYVSESDIRRMTRNKDLQGLESIYIDGGTRGRQDAARKAIDSLVPNSKEDVENLLADLKNNNFQGSQEAASVLRRIDPNFAQSESGRAVVPLLVTALEDNRTQIAAADTLAVFGPQAKDAVPVLEKKFNETKFGLDAAAESSELFRLTAVLIAIWKIHPNNPESVAFVTTALKSTYGTQRKAAVKTVEIIDRDFLLSVAGAEIIRSLATLAVEFHGDGAFDAGYLLEEMGPVARAAVPILEAALRERRGKSDHYFQERITKTLNKIDPRGARSRLQLNER